MMKGNFFFNNLRAATRQEVTTQRSFTRPPRRRPSQRVEAEPQVEESPRFIEAAVPAVPEQDQIFGQRKMLSQEESLSENNLMTQAIVKISWNK
jgi:hypothetical protein